jgi:hypothetical protein
MIIEDKNKDVISFTLYNSIEEKLDFEDVQKYFPIGTMIGIKQPYLKISYYGNLSLRNDNPENIMFEE